MSNSKITFAQDGLTVAHLQKLVPTGDLQKGMAVGHLEMGLTPWGTFRRHWQVPPRGKAVAGGNPPLRKTGEIPPAPLRAVWARSSGVGHACNFGPDFGGFARGVGHCPRRGPLCNPKGE